MLAILLPKFYFVAHFVTNFVSNFLLFFARIENWQQYKKLTTESEIGSQVYYKITKLPTKKISKKTEKLATKFALK